MTDSAKARIVLTMNTFAFAVCFASWMMNAVLITFLVTNGVFDWTPSQVGLLLATPVLTGALLRLPAGMLSDRFGGRPVYTLLMLVSAAAFFLNSYVQSFGGFLAAALGFGLSGASFAVGVAYTAVWFPKERQGTALGIFGAGNTGTVATLLFAPTLLKHFTNAGTNLDGWRMLPRVYSAALAAMAILFWFCTFSRKPAGASKTLAQRLSPLGNARVWRFGIYYMLLFGGFVALSNWLVPYYVKAYGLPLAAAGMFASFFALPTGLMRAVGGWLADRFGARTIMNWVLAACCFATFALLFPKMDIITPGEGILAKAPGVVVSMTDRELVVKQTKTGKLDTYRLAGTPGEINPASHETESRFALIPHSRSWQSWATKNEKAQSGEVTLRAFRPGDTIAMRELLARGSTHIYFQANVYVFMGIVLFLGIAMGIGSAAVYKHIPTYFPDDVGVVGGLVGVIGGLGGFFFPMLFGYLLNATGVWTTCWMLLLAMSIVCLVWMRIVINRMVRSEAPQLLAHFDQVAGAKRPASTVMDARPSTA